MDQNFLTVDELSEKLRVHRSWIYARTRETGPESMPRLHVGKYLRFIENDVMNWLKNQANNQN